MTQSVLITPAPSRSPDDLRLQRRITKALRKSGRRALAAVQCEVSTSLAVLRGAVSSYYLKQLAQAAALEVDGVRNVENMIEVQ
jgi:osmotically-inducible protein OsmY